MSGYVRASVAALEAYTPGEQPSDPGVLKLNTNENPYPPSPAVAEALRAADPAVLRRYPDPLCTRLRARLAERHGVEPSQVLAGNGSDEVLALCSRAFVEPPDPVGWFEPSYSLYPVLARIAGAEGRPVALGDDFGWRMPPGYAASLFFLATPNAPTGRVYDPRVVESFCRAFPGVVLLDEAYADFSPHSFAHLARTEPNVLVARTLSKSYSLAGLRFGYAIGPRPLIDALHRLRDSYNVDRLAQDLALAALGDRAWMEANVRRIVATRERTADALRGQGFEVGPSAANFLWVRPPRMEARAYFEALRGRKVLVRHFPGPRTGAHVRITIGTDAQMERFLAATGDALASA